MRLGQVNTEQMVCSSSHISSLFLYHYFPILLLDFVFIGFIVHLLPLLICILLLSLLAVIECVCVCVCLCV